MSDINPSYVLFMCDANIVRSAMAACITKEFFRHEIYIDSAGVNPSHNIDGFAISVMEEIGVDMSSHRAKEFKDLEDTSFELIIALSQNAYDKALEFAKMHHVDVEFWEIDDITTVQGSREMILEAYRKIRNLIYQKIFERFKVDDNKVADRKNWNLLTPS